MMGAGSGEDDRSLRLRMVATQLRSRGIADERVLAAFERVPRHRFVAGEDLARCYGDYPLPISCGQTISQPYVVACTLAALRLQPADCVLEVGTGSGYQTALLAELANCVCSLEYHAPLAEGAAQRLAELGYRNVEVRVADGNLGWPGGGSFAAIAGSAAATRVPPALLQQLAPGGRLVMPVGSWQQQLVLLCRDLDGSVQRRDLLPVRFVPLLGEP